MKSKTTKDVKIKDLFIRTVIENDLNFYYNFPVEMQDDYGTGAYIMAGVEIAKYLKNKGK